jgi:hypothetical protein
MAKPSEYIEKALTYLLENRVKYNEIAKAEYKKTGRLNYDFTNAYGQMINNLKDNLNNKISKVSSDNNLSNYGNFYNVYNMIGTNITDYPISNLLKSMLPEVDYYPSIIKDVIIHFCTVYIDDNYKINYNDDIEIVISYVNKILVKVIYLFSNDTSKYFNDINELNKLTRQFNIEYHIMGCYPVYNSDIISKIIRPNIENIKPIMEFLEKYYKNIKTIENTVSQKAIPAIQNPIPLSQKSGIVNSGIGLRGISQSGSVQKGIGRSSIVNSSIIYPVKKQEPVTQAPEQVTQAPEPVIQPRNVEVHPVENSNKDVVKTKLKKNSKKETANNDNNDNNDDNNDNNYDNNTNNTNNTNKDVSVVKASSAKSKKIPAAVRKIVWNTYIGKDNKTGKCLVCSAEDISITNFECGHIKSRINDGDTTVENLRPICGNCNKSIGGTNMDTFMEKYKINKPANWNGFVNNDNPASITEKKTPIKLKQKKIVLDNKIETETGNEQENETEYETDTFVMNITNFEKLKARVTELENDNKKLIKEVKSLKAKLDNYEK